jgi:citronellol/citronellal dehydrogenase
MDDRQKQGFADAALSTHPTVYAADALKDQVALVSGGAGGIGRAIAWLFARLGAHVVVVGRDQGKLDTLVAELAVRNLKASAHAADIREPEAVDALFEKVWAAHNRLDILVNSAGGQFPQPAIDFSIKGWNAVINTNLNGTWYMMQAAAKRWRDHKRPGNIVNIVVVTTHGLYGIAHTIAARSGVIGLTRAVAVEWAPLNIRVNCISPGSISTEGLNVYPEEAVEHFSKSNPMRSLGDVYDVAQGVVYLSADTAKFITGEVLVIDGGNSQWGDVWPGGKPDYFRVDEV